MARGAGAAVAWLAAALCVAVGVALCAVAGLAATGAWRAAGAACCAAPGLCFTGAGAAFAWLAAWGWADAVLAAPAAGFAAPDFAFTGATLLFCGAPFATVAFAFVAAGLAAGLAAADLDFETGVAGLAVFFVASAFLLAAGVFVIAF